MLHGVCPCTKLFQTPCHPHAPVSGSRWINFNVSSISASHCRWCCSCRCWPTAAAPGAAPAAAGATGGACCWTSGSVVAPFPLTAAGATDTVDELPSFNEANTGGKGLRCGAWLQCRMRVHVGGARVLLAPLLLWGRCPWWRAAANEDMVRPSQTHSYAARTAVGRKGAICSTIYPRVAYATSCKKTRLNQQPNKFPQHNKRSVW